MTVPEVWMMPSGGIMCPIPAEDEEVVIIRKVAGGESRRSGDLLEGSDSDRIPDTKHIPMPLNPIDGIRIGSDDIGIKRICHHQNNVLTPPDGPEVIVKDRSPHKTPSSHSSAETSPTDRP